MRGIIAFVCCLFTTAFASTKQGNQRVATYREAKRHLVQIYRSGKTLYCDCAFRGSRINYTGCSYRPQTDRTRAARMEWEHVVPASKFGRTFAEWTRGHRECRTRTGRAYKGRRCLEKISGEFRRIISDMYNLYPSIGEVNGLRANYPMTEIPGEERRFGTCDLEIKSAKVEPRPSIRGDIARVYFYMSAVYPKRVVLSQAQRQMYLRWDRQDPVDNDECDRYQRIKRVQGNDNAILSARCGRKK